MGSKSDNEMQLKCFIYVGWRNSTAKDFISLGYEGIPQNLLFNIVGCCFMVVLFSILRKKAWNYGRIAFFQQNERQQRGSKYKDVLFGGVANEGPQSSNGRSRNAERGPSPVEIYVDDHGMFSWIVTTFKLTDDQIRAKSGQDAVHYLSFQRHLIFIACIITVVSIVIVLPINFQGNLQSSVSEFRSSTIINLGDSGKLLWVHVSLTIVYLIVTVAVLRHFSKALAVAERDPIISRTIMVSRIAKRNSHTEKLKNHFLEIYPDVQIEEISFAYNISRLQKAALCKTAALSARIYWENYLAIKGKRPKMRPYTCGKLCCCCSICGLKSSDAIEYYMKEEERYGKLVETERKRALSLPLGIAFVTFTSVDMAHRIVTDYRLTARCFKQRPQSTFSRKLKSNQWVVNYAPLPEDLYWENLALSYKAWYFKAILVNVVLILLVCVYSTPVVILNAINKDLKIREKVSKFTGLVTAGLATNTAPTLLLWITAVSLPSLVSFSDRIIGFWTKTAENRSRMVKTFTFLLFMVIILPSLGAQSLIRHLSGNTTWKKNFSCIFYTENGVFFVNYMITSSFLGTASELMRLYELLYYTVKLCFAKSSAEIDSIRKSVVWDFQLGLQYAWTMLNFTMFVIFSLICPIITPFGLVYVILKHYVDRYNVYFAYAPCKVDKEVHVTAINFVVVTMFLLQIIMLAYTNTNQDDSNKLLKVFSILGFCITSAFFVGQVFFNMCTNFSPISYQKMDAVEGGDVKQTMGTAMDETTPLENEVDRALEVKVNASVNGNGCPGTAFYRRRLIENETEQMGRYFPKILCSDCQSEVPAANARSYPGSSNNKITNQSSLVEHHNHNKKKNRHVSKDIQIQVQLTSDNAPTSV